MVLEVSAESLHPCLLVTHLLHRIMKVASADFDRRIKRVKKHVKETGAIHAFVLPLI